MSEHWLQHELSSLLSSPGPIRIPRLPFGLRGGPGPIDVFSSRFANLFSDDVRATINGIDYDKAGLKDKVVELKQYYDPDSATEELAESTRNHGICCRISWSGKSGGRSSALRDDSPIVVTFDVTGTVPNGNLQKVKRIKITTDTPYFNL